MGIVELFFPTTCLGCGKEGSYICRDCLSKVRLTKQVCPYCYKSSIDGFTHAKCVRKLGLDGLTSVWEFDGVVRKAILTLKYKYATQVGRELCGIFAEYIKSSLSLMPRLSTLTPVPIFWYRENVRGFNQSSEIGRRVSTDMGWNFVPNLLLRLKSTKPQVELSGSKRRQNLKGVFTMNSLYLGHTFPNIVLFDDVFTTGSTLREAAKVLKRRGVGKVWGLTIAR